MSVGRKRTTEHEKDAIKQFNALIKEHSLDAVKNIVKISNSFLRRMIVEERQVPYIQVGTKYIINYSLFLQRLNEKGD